MTKLTKEVIRLLQLAGVAPTEAKAAAWLRNAIEVARTSYQSAGQQPLLVDHNALLDGIGKKAQALTNEVQRLDRHPITWRAFWRSGVFGPVSLNRAVDREVLSVLNNIVRAANAGLDSRKGRPREAAKQHVVDRACGFFERYSSHTISGTPTGAFAIFARAFYAVAIGDAAGEHDSLERQIRQAAKRFSSRRQLAGRKSSKNPSDLS